MSRPLGRALRDIPQKIGPQCVLGVLCLPVVLFLSVGMMFSNISEKVNFKVDKSLQFLSGKCMAEHFLLSLSLSLIITEGFRARRANIGNSTLQTLHSKGKFLEIKRFLTYSILSRFCLKFVQVFFTWYLTISRKDPLISI